VLRTLGVGDGPPPVVNLNELRPGSPTGPVGGPTDGVITGLSTKVLSIMLSESFPCPLLGSPLTRVVADVVIAVGEKVSFP
jgi:hypothetical protein